MAPSSLNYQQPNSTQPHGFDRSVFQYVQEFNNTLVYLWDDHGLPPPPLHETNGIPLE